MKRFLWLLAACSSSPAEFPNTRPTWGIPVIGGTMLATRDGTLAVIADPDRDRIVSVRLDDNRVASNVALPAGSEPGRVIEDGDGRIHVALRGNGSVLTLEPTSGTIIGERFVCSEPRGLAWDSTSDLVHVACATGALVRMPAAGGEAVVTAQLPRDLRDVIVRGSELVVTRFRSPELITVDAAGAIIDRVVPPTLVRRGAVTGESIPVTPAVAWRTIALPDGRILMSHQRKQEVELRIVTGGYGQQTPDDCRDDVIESAMTVLAPGAAPVALRRVLDGALPVDVAVDHQLTLAFATAGSSTLQVVTGTALGQIDDDCDDREDVIGEIDDRLGMPTSVAFTPAGALLAFYPELPALVVRNAPDPAAPAVTIALPGKLGYDAGRALFHRQTSAGMACASCHPEGRDDGQVWRFSEIGPRRTQSLAGGILSRAPYHWTGDLPDLPVLMLTVFERMSGGAVTPSEEKSLGPWLDRVRALEPNAVDSDAVTRGGTLFRSPALGCASCHVGPLYTNNQLHNVGTGALFKVPSLVGLAARAPFMHDGCAATLADRFGPCGGGDSHGKTSTLTPAQLADLIAFLESL